MNALHFVYFADPMCSWCWGFSPVIEAIQQKHGEGLPIRLIMGGLRPGTREPMDELAKRDVRSHWEHVHEASGQPFDFSFFDRQGFIYDTEPAARAVVLARRDGPAHGFAYLRLVHAAFYAENRDVTAAEVLADLADELGFEREAFLKEFHTVEAKRETQQDFAIAHRAGVTGFPTLIAGPGTDGAYALVTQGFQPAERIVPAIDGWLASKCAA
jgi:putative protein-disulfide isomerase